MQTEKMQRVLEHLSNEKNLVVLGYTGEKNIAQLCGDYNILGGGFKYVNNPIWLTFSKGLKPPASIPL